MWLKGALAGKFAGVFVSTGTPGGGQETTVISSMSTLVHHGMIFVPLGYKDTFPHLSNVSEVRGGMYPPFRVRDCGLLISALAFNKVLRGVQAPSLVLTDHASPQLLNLKSLTSRERTSGRSSPRASTRSILKLRYDIRYFRRFHNGHTEFGVREHVHFPDFLMSTWDMQPSSYTSQTFGRR